ncbi:c-type cytochrome [Kordiimonas marina]|uniref:c-type cytochrome n=1 Tax=Kordiimonas marina TaxID=2872312 RepID=UPI001FF2332D|nr:c-type cytochrome [Kordiimonas marina]MCJ9428524.1 c-type cytochrome [Kordiimonas marina]
MSGLALAMGLASAEATPRTERGQSIFMQCANCHTLTKGGRTIYGPNLHNIIGRRIASMPGFDYSPALSAEGGIWTVKKLDRFLARPQMAVKGTHMTFKGLLNPHDREDLIAWLEAVQAHKAPPVSPSLISQILDKGDPVRGQKLFRPCTVCHSYEAGAKNKIGPNLYGVVGRPVASAPGFHYSARLKEHGGFWTPETLNSFMTEKKPFGQGSHLAFKKLGKPSDRADIIAYLKSLSPEYRESTGRVHEGPIATRP